jgi:hypothetical protein
VREVFLQDAVILPKDARAFTGALLKAQLEMFPCFTANVAALDRLLGPLTAPAPLLMPSVLLSGCTRS